MPQAHVIGPESYNAERLTALDSGSEQPMNDEAAFLQAMQERPDDSSLRRFQDFS
jgi:hypothetical protein